ncbi:hypothetical protein SADUNF_Sadunf13G0039700 [Salix dunnii]|uniref:Uncharacterized protein n=1 Tax=Salix dunnii TaxID=1413687 RepID=A0A835MLL4_9ROSI|nr:hypothetical protein SADUNF_Sadunf13G0039700 [Salix dunnii]
MNMNQVAVAPCGALTRDFYAHLGSIPVPQKVKQKECHADPGEHYCDVYEMPRNPMHPVPSGDECKFITHIGCVIVKARHRSPHIFYGDAFYLSGRCFTKGTSIGKVMNWDQPLERYLGKNEVFWPNDMFLAPSHNSVPPSKPCCLQEESLALNARQLQRESFWFLPATLGFWQTSGVFQAEVRSREQSISSITIMDLLDVSISSFLSSVLSFTEVNSRS